MRCTGRTKGLVDEIEVWLPDSTVGPPTESVSMAVWGRILRIRRPCSPRPEPARRAAWPGGGSPNSHRSRGHQGTGRLRSTQRRGEKGAPVVRKVSENAWERHPSFSLLWYVLWYDFSNLLFLLNYWRRGRDSNPRWAFNPYSLSRGAPSAARPPLRNDWRIPKGEITRKSVPQDPALPLDEAVVRRTLSEPPGRQHGAAGWFPVCPPDCSVLRS